MNGILDAAEAVDGRLRALGFRYCLIGGIALQRWGQPRTTLDVDVTVMTEFGKEKPVIRRLLENFRPRIEDAEEFALQSRTLLLVSDSNVGIDISLGAIPFESRMVDRSSPWRLGEERRLRTCSAEDLVTLKAFAGRPQDWVDVQSILDRQGAKLDRGLILQESDELFAVKDDATGLRRLQNMLPADVSE